MISINNSVVVEQISENKTEIDTIISQARKEVLNFRNNPDKPGGKGKPRVKIILKRVEEQYLDKLIEEFEEIVLANPKEIKLFKDDFDAIIHSDNMASNHKEFKNELLNRLGYSKLRNNFYAKYYEGIGVKACVYCNSQLAVTVRTIKGERSAKFQVDHFYPKAEYPCFSISFFNLLPTCSVCNNKKRTQLIDFEVYSDKPVNLKQSPFTFQLDKKSLVLYRVNGITEKLIIKFDDPGKKKFNKHFDIEGIYSTQKDLAEELVLKSLMYNENYLISLRESFKKLYPNKIPMAERLIVGNYTRQKDIHKRPMSKFTQDIAKQLKII